MKFVEGNIYICFDMKFDEDPFEYEIVQCKCVDAKNLYFETIGSNSGWSDSQYDDLEAANRFIFSNLRNCQRGMFRMVLK